MNELYIRVFIAATVVYHRIASPFTSWTLLLRGGSLFRSRHQKAVEALLTEAGLMEPPRMPTRAICGAWLAARAGAEPPHFVAVPIEAAVSLNRKRR